MFNRLLKTKPNGVPVVSKKELDSMGEELIWDFQPEVFRTPAPVDIERFVECYLGMTPDYQYLSHNGVYLGMTVFNDTDKVPIYDPTTNRAEYISAKARTVIIDNRLLEDNQEHRYRFTLGHEGSHDILHSKYFSYQQSQIELFKNLFGDTMHPMIQCRVDSSSQQKRDPDKWSDHDWMEWQANRLSSAILMPKRAVELVVEPYLRCGCTKNFLFRMKLITQVSMTFNVSHIAAEIRLKDLGYFAKDNMNYAFGTAFADFSPTIGG